MNFKNLRHYFLPHPETHKKAHLLHWHYLVIYILLFVLLKLSFNLVDFYKPGILGVNSNITVSEIVDGTNQQRAKLGLPPLTLNANLSKAAELKAANMYAENYWAHFSPSGKDPWGFILGSGYKFSYAGENLARNFYQSDEVVRAWMNSPTHRDNIINSKYTDIGIAVVDGVLLGQKTTLVVQEFGRPYDAISQAPTVAVSGQKFEVSTAELLANRPVLSEVAPKNVLPALIDPYSVSRDVGLMMVLGLGILILLDLYVLKRRGVFRLSSHHLAHVSILALAGTSLMTSSGGSIL